MDTPTNDSWVREALDEFAAMNGRQNETLLMETSTVLLDPFLALLDGLMDNAALDWPIRETIAQKRDGLFTHIKETLGAARARVLHITPSQVRLQALILALRTEAP